MNERSTLSRTIGPRLGHVAAHALLAALTLGALPRPALAQQQNASAAEVSAARGLFLEGLKLADSGRCADAIDKFERAERLHHAITIVARLGECQVELGKIVQGTETLLRASRESLPPNAPRAFTNAQTRAQKVLDAALPKIAKLKVSIKGAPEAGVTVTLDGEAVPNALLDAARPTDPGPHVIEADAPGFLKESARVTLADGDSQSVALTLKPDPNAPKAAPPEAPRDGPQGATRGPLPAGDEGGGQSRLPVYVAFGVGAVGLAAGTFFGLTALSKRSNLNDRCPERDTCPKDARSDIDSMSRSATFSTVGFGVGLAGAGVGVALLLLSSKPSSPPAGAASAAPRVGAWVGPQSLGLAGSF